MLTVWLFAVLGAALAVLLICGIITMVRHRNSDGGFICALLGGLFLGCLLVGAAITIPCMHTTVLGIPMRIAALERTIEQQTALISEDATLGQGLEGLEIKREIQNGVNG